MKWTLVIIAALSLTRCSSDNSNRSDGGSAWEARPCAEARVPSATQACPAACTGGCADGVCTIVCSGSSCKDGVITCPEDLACLVRCEGADACDTSEITCPAEYACTVTCLKGVDTCGDVTLQCGAGPCAIQCGLEGTCTGSAVNCGAGPCRATCEGKAALTVNCNGACECTRCEFSPME